MQSQNTMIYAFIMFILFWIYVYAAEYTLTFDRVEPIKGDKENLAEFSNLKIIRKGSDYYMNGTYTFVDDLDNSFTVEATTAYSPLENSRFIKQPYHVPKAPSCEFFNTSYKKLIEPCLVNTNFPVIPPEGLCPIPKGTYFMKDSTMIDGVLPPHLSRGIWKAELRFFKDGNCVGGAVTLSRIRNKH
ncbi:uncharacterized protein LOC129951710 [Eupeodes corollae]|uniref:uncharacterized protein LOC129951710 n=1 Tax=Eupeodes corollae TaxID=290404 RepID=UPI00248F876A|nr:uncharacterized protein LOC129951710 [Eupeodes corollae]